MFFYKCLHFNIVNDIRNMNHLLVIPIVLFVKTKLVLNCHESTHFTRRKGSVESN
jgi:hypothetical protein